MLRGVRVRRVDDPASFAQLVEPLLLRDEARHNLQLGILATLRDHPDTYPGRLLWVVDRAGEVVGAALRTPPFPLTIAQPTSGGAIEAMVAHLAGTGTDLPGVVGAEPEVHRFSGAWTARTGASPRTLVRQTIHSLEQVRPVRSAPGGHRLATSEDRELLGAWQEAFRAEAVPHQRSDEAAHRLLEARLAPGEDSGMWLWQDGGRPVSMAGFSGPTPGGIRVGPVFTPPGLRGRGYATSLVATLSAWLLGRGRRRCFLYTDRANPTSNAIYRSIGYEPVCDGAEIEFAAATSMA